ncbi:MAG: class I SAM-dependent methyltransferase [Myxococcota bacterium]
MLVAYDKPRLVVESKLDYRSLMGRPLRPATEGEVTAKVEQLSFYLRGLLDGFPRGGAVDLGCGTGTVLGALERLGFSPLHGCEIDEKQAQLLDAIETLTVKMQSAPKFLESFDEGSLSWISAFDVLEHMGSEDVVSVLRLAHSRLRTEGVLVIQVPNAGSPFFGSVQYGDPTHQTVFARGALEALLRDAGFESITVRETGPVPKGFLGTVRTGLWHGAKSLFSALNAVETGVLKAGPWSRVMIAVARR